MKKALFWIRENILFVSSLFLLAFIPLYPKIPLVDILNTWVYIRIEDLIVLFVLFLWLTLLFRKKITLKTPLTLPIIIFWVVGAIATIHGVLLIFPTMANVFPNVAFLSLLRRIEYVSLFFIGFSGMRDKRFFPYAVGVVTVTFFLVFVYGMGQKYLGFPAFLTMNEEFAKGLPIRLSALSRVPSTFAGHYDLAAYLVLIVPILASLVFGVKKWFLKGIFSVLVLFGFILLFMTVSRVSFFVLFISLLGVFLLQKKKLVLFFIPLAVLAVAILFIRLGPALFERFGNTVKKIDVLVDARTGEALGHARIVPASYFEGKTIKKNNYQSGNQLQYIITEEREPDASSSSLLTSLQIPKTVALVSPPNASTGENLPQGTGYINLPLSPVTKRVGEFFYERPPHLREIKKDAFMFEGEFLIKRASAYDLSLTTRYQGEWPRAIEAFKRNILFGSGYGSVSLAVDNNYLRILGETGILGFLSFFAIFVATGIYFKKTLPNIDSKLTRSFIVGFSAGVGGLMLNALLIDVFDASKIAYSLWLLTGITLGVLQFYQKEKINLILEFKKIAISPFAIVSYLLIFVVVMFSLMLGNFFVADDFTWLRWASECGIVSPAQDCPSILKTIIGYFTDATGFFYRPGTKLFFLFMYPFFWLNQSAYHFVSISLHLTTAILFFFLAKKILGDKLFSSVAAFLFLILSGYSEAVFWISSIGYLFNAVFILSSLLFFTLWDDKKKNIYFVFCLITLTLSFLFHEMGVVAPLLIIMYKMAKDGVSVRNVLKKRHYLLLFVPLVFYGFLRLISGSHWTGGDYTYNLLKLPFNFIGNLLGYFMLTLLGPAFLPINQSLRSLSNKNIPVIAALIVLALFVVFFIYKFIVTKKKINVLVSKLELSERRAILFGFLFFTISLLPFLGFGNIAPRYSYLASLGLIIVFAIFMKKLYIHLLSYGREIAVLTISMVVLIFSLLHIIQLQQLHKDWRESGEIVRKFFISIDTVFADSWKEDNISFYFINVPVMRGNAWLFPVGIEDAVWFPTQNKNLKVYTTSDLEYALKQARDSQNVRVFKFMEDGSLEEKRPEKISPNQLE